MFLLPIKKTSEQPWSNGESISHTVLWEEIQCHGSPPPSSNHHHDRTRTLLSLLDSETYSDSPVLPCRVERRMRTSSLPRGDRWMTSVKTRWGNLYWYSSPWTLGHITWYRGGSRVTTPRVDLPTNTYWWRKLSPRPGFDVRFLLKPNIIFGHHPVSVDQTDLYQCFVKSYNTYSTQKTVYSRFFESLFLVKMWSVSRWTCKKKIHTNSPCRLPDVLGMSCFCLLLDSLW